MSGADLPHQNPLPILNSGLSFPDFLKIRPPPFSPPSTASEESYEVPRTYKNTEYRPLTYPVLPPKPTIPLPIPPVHEIVSPSKSRLEAVLDNKSSFSVRSKPGNLFSSDRMPPTSAKVYDPKYGTISNCYLTNRIPPLPTSQPPTNSIYEAAFNNNFVILGRQSTRLSNDTAYAQRSVASIAPDRQSFMRSANEFSHNDLATSLMGSSNDSREDPRCFQSICSQGRRQVARQKVSSSGLCSWLFNEKSAIIYFISLVLLLFLFLITIGLFVFFKNSNQYIYSDDDIISADYSPHALEFGLSGDFTLPSRRIVYFELPIQHDTDIALLFNVSDSQAKFVVYARQTLLPTPTTYSYRRIITAEHIHYRSLNSKNKRSISTDDTKQFFEETLVRNSLIALNDVQAGRWFFGFLNDNIRPLSIRLTPVATPKPDHRLTSSVHGCKFDCFGKGSCVKNQCVCYPGFSGKFCQETLCPVLCSGNGVFTNGRCFCHVNYKGPTCDESISSCPNGRCESIETRVPEALNANKEITEPTPNQQTLQKDPEPTIISVSQDGQCSKECDKHGKCVNGICVCHNGWNGENCLVRGCPVNNCNSNGECHLIGGKNPRYQCFCNTTHFGPNCEYPLETECSDDIDNDGDGLIDCADSECCSSPSCSNHPLCISDLQRLAVPGLELGRPETSFKKQIEFLLGPDSAQKYADLTEFDERRISVIRGRILSRKAGPLTGVRVSNLNSPKQGFTLTRSSNGGGFFVFVCNGNYVRLSFLRHPFGAVERSFFIPENQILDVGDIFIDNEEPTLNSTNINERCRSIQIAHNFKPNLITTSMSSSDNFNSNMDMEDGIRLDAERREIQIISTIEPSNSVQIVYSSDRAPQAASILYIQLLGSQIPLNLEIVRLKIQVAGSVFEREFVPEASLQYEFSWNRRNVFGQDVVGTANAKCEVFYEYKDCESVYFLENIQLAGKRLMQVSDFGLWSLNINHYYDVHNHILERGDGQKIYLDRTPLVVRTIVVGDSGQQQRCQDCQNQKRSTDQLCEPASIITLPDGSIIFSDCIRVKRMNGQKVETILELSGEEEGHHRLALDSVKNEVYVVLQHQVLKLKKVEKVRDPKTNFRIVAGSGEKCTDDTNCSNGDNKAKSAKFNVLKGISFDKNSGFYLADGRSIRYVNRHGELENLLAAPSEWSWTFECPRAFRLELLNLQEPLDLIVEPFTQDIFVLDKKAIYRINVYRSTVHLIVGRMHNCGRFYQNDREDIQHLNQMALDPQSNYLYLTESDGKRMHRVRRVSTNGGPLEDIAGRFGNCDCNKLSCPCDEQHTGEVARDSLFHNLKGISIDRSGRIFVVDSGNFKIKVLETPASGQHQQLYQINSTEASEIYEFDQNGRHLRTKDLFDGQNKYVFSYSTDDRRLVNIKMRYTNMTFSTQDSSVLVQTSQSQETTIQTKSADEEGVQQVYAISNWRGVSAIFKYGENQLISQTKIGKKTHVIQYDQNGRALSIEELTTNSKIEMLTPLFDEYEKLQTTVLKDGHIIGIVERTRNDLVVKGKAIRAASSFYIDHTDLDSIYISRLSNRSNGFEFDANGRRFFYELASRPSPNDGYVTRRRFVFPELESGIPELVLQYELHTFQLHSKTRQAIKLNGQTLISRVFDPSLNILKIRDPSDNDLLSIQMNSRVSTVQFGSTTPNKVNLKYNEVGQLERIDWLDRSLFNFYDNQHRLIQQKIKGDGIELARSFRYSGFPYPVAVELNNGSEYQLNYEPGGRLQSIRTPLGNEHKFELKSDSDSDSELVRTLPSGQHLKAVYNSDGQISEFFANSTQRAQWTRNDFGRVINFNTSTTNFNIQYRIYKKESEETRVHSDYSKFFVKQDRMCRVIKEGAENETRFSFTLYTYDDAGRIVQVSQSLDNGRTLKFNTTYAYDFIGKLSSIGNALIIRGDNSIQLVHPKFELNFNYTPDRQLSGVTFTHPKKTISAKFAYNSLSLLNTSVWRVDGDVIEHGIFNYKDGRLSSFEDEYTGSETDQIDYTEDGSIKPTVEMKMETNEIGWIVSQEALSFTYDALGQLVRLVDKATNSTFKYVYNEKQRLVQRRTDAVDQKTVTFYYGLSNDPNSLSRFSFDSQTMYAIHYIDDRPVMLENLNEEETYALVTDSYGSIRQIINETGFVVESRSYTPFGQMNATKSWTLDVPVGYMGFVEDHGIIFVYDEDNQVTRPLSAKLGRFMSSSYSLLKSQINILRPELETEIFRFEHGRSLSNLFPTTTKQWLQLAGISHLHSTENKYCNGLISSSSICSLERTLNVLSQFFDFNYFNSPFQMLVPVL